MKNIIFRMIIISLVLTGCTEDFLNLTSPNAVSQEIFWQTENDVKLALTGCYAVLQNTHMYNSVHNGNAGF